jgi:hypothetical protein
VVRQDLTNETAKIADAIGAEFLHSVRTQHPVTLKPRFTEKSISTDLVRKGFVSSGVFNNIRGPISTFIQHLTKNQTLKEQTHNHPIKPSSKEPFL